MKKKNYNKIIIDCNSKAEPDEPEKKNSIIVLCQSNYEDEQEQNL